MKIVVALGGNALGNNPEEQLRMAGKSASIIVDLIEEGHDVVISHGNGPQIGMIVNAFETIKKIDDTMPTIPFPEAIAMSQGYIGYHLQRKLNMELRKRGIDRPVATVVTEIVVDKEDQAFKNPTKPIGSFYSKEEAEAIMKDTGYKFIEDSGRGYRRVVASPIPREVVEIDSIDTLVNSGKIVITVGGGGIPVYREGEDLIGIDCVVDKDFASAILAQQLDADYLVILTEVDKVALNFNKDNEYLLSELRVGDIDRYIKEGHFAAGSMLPKVEAAGYFARIDGKKSLITSLKNAAAGLKGETGTVILR